MCFRITRRIRVSDISSLRAWITVFRLAVFACAVHLDHRDITTECAPQRSRERLEHCMGDTRLPFFAALLGALEEIPAVCTTPDPDIADGVDAASVETCFQAMPPEQQALCAPARGAFRELMHAQASVQSAAARLTGELAPVVKPLVLEALCKRIAELPVPVLCTIVAIDQASTTGDLSELTEAMHIK